MTSLIFATANTHKLAELSAILPDYDIQGLKDIGIDTDIPETGSTLEENAYIKAKFLFDHTGCLSLSEDTGLEVDAIGGQPGVHTARYAGDHRHPMDNMLKLLEELANKQDRTARFRTVIALVDVDRTLYFEGIVSGQIAMEINGTEGFGYDPVFIPEGYHNTFAELSSGIKNTISHRARAVKKLMEYLQAN